MVEAKRHYLSRAEIFYKSVKNFNEGDLVRVGKYYIWIRNGRGSYVNTSNSLLELKDSQMPNYIFNFLYKHL